MNSFTKADNKNNLSDTFKSFISSLTIYLQQSRSLLYIGKLTYILSLKNASTFTSNSANLVFPNALAITGIHFQFYFISSFFGSILSLNRFLNSLTNSLALSLLIFITNPAIQLLTIALNFFVKLFFTISPFFILPNVSLGKLRRNKSLLLPTQHITPILSWQNTHYLAMKYSRHRLYKWSTAGYVAFVSLNYALNDFNYSLVHV